MVIIELLARVKVAESASNFDIKTDSCSFMWRLESIEQRHANVDSSCLNGPNLKGVVV